MARPPRVFRLLPGCSGGRSADDAGGSCIPERRSVAYDRRERAARASACLVSVLLHTLAVLLSPAVSIPVEGIRDPDAARRAARPPLQVIAVRQPERSPATPSGRHVIAVRVPEIPAVSAALTRRGPDLTLAEAASPGWAVPAPPEVVGPAASSDEGDEYNGPIALGILEGWRPRAPLHGVEITVRVHTSEAGHATGPVELVPETADPRLNRALVSRVRELAYRPARRVGQPIAAWAEITFIFCHSGITATSPASPSGLADPCADMAERARLASREAGDG